jgi:hypothetical protein
MTRATLLAVACALSCLTAVPAARAIPIKCDKSPYDVDLVVVHANGVRTDLAGAKANLERLRPLVDRQLGQQPYAISYGLAYNQRKGWLASIYKLAKERLARSDAQAIRMLGDLDNVPGWLREELIKLAAEREQIGFEGDASLERQVTMYREQLRSGRKVVVIAHSEGNMYANAAYRRLFETVLETPGERSFGIVGVALPAPSLAGTWFPAGCSSLGCYTTLEEDLVIGGVQAVLPDTAPSNVPDETVGTSDLNRHDLIDTYLRNPASRERILAHVGAFVSSFEPLETTLNDSAITAYLEWDTDADLDLHVYEGGGGHVYAAFPESEDGGQLDADDMDGYGPEHYFAECDLLKAGDLRFAVGYYEGDGPVTARLRIKVGNTVRAYRRELTRALGTRSFTEPEAIASIHVTNLDDDKRYDSKNQLIDDYEIAVIGATER